MPNKKKATAKKNRGQEKVVNVTINVHLLDPSQLTVEAIERLAEAAGKYLSRSPEPPVSSRRRV
jgi:ribosomal protein L16/L10AE